MSAIYQRARPIRWDEVVGQEHVKDVLRAALEGGRVGHAYLFSGPRGVGKTTTARLIAMTANCSGPSPKPCGECESCRSVRAGSHPDVLEIDAASNNSVDDVRDLREKVGLAAMRGGKKIYILDEAHMMSRAAFNALLKTLEEPPGHVIFILATTEPEKIIPTILSRCQHYRFRRLTPEEIAGKLSELARREGVQADPDALHLIGRLADGAMRDGESLLERMLAAGTAVTRPAVEEALGLPPGERVRAVAAALVLGDAAGALSGAGALYRDGFAARTIVEGLVAAFGAALHAELGLSGGPEAGGRLDGADVPRLLKLQAALDEQDARFARSADGLSLELALTHALLAADGGGGGGNSAATARAPATAAAAGGIPADLAQRLNRLEKELATLKASPPQGSGRGPALTGATAEVPDFDPTARRGAGSGGTGSGPAAVREVVGAALEGVGGSASPALQGSWDEVTRKASMQLKAFLKPARKHAEPGYVSLGYDEKNAFHAKQVAGKFDELAALVGRVFGPVTFELIAPEGGRKLRVGGEGSSGGAASAPVAPAETAGRTAPAAQARAEAPRQVSRTPEGSGGGVEGGVAVVSPPRPARAASTRGPSFEPLEPIQATAQPSAPAVAPRTAPPRAPQRSMPDDVAPAPLPDPSPAPWEDGPAAVAPATAPPQASAGQFRADQARADQTSRELYIVEAITEEPDWGDIGEPGLGSSAPPPLDDAPYASFMPERPAPAPRPAPTPAAPSASVPPTPAAAGPGRPADIRAHPMYEEIKGRFSGRVREIGKNRNPTPAAAADADGEDDEATEAEGA